ncbi:MAG: cysteine desulfurase, partial [Clostridia bacterium]|nr:cysteine desulfurase [Clostridia bacterium]
MIYLDNAATTKPYKEVVDILKTVNESFWANPSSTHSLGQKVLNEIDSARDDIAKILNVKSKEIYFTSGGTESDNWLIRGVATSKNNTKKTIITSSIEHHAVLETCKYLESIGYKVIYLKPNKDGLISLDDLRNAICDDVCLVTIMYVNNEVGVIQPIEQIASICHENNILCHSDMVQAIPYLDIDIKKLGIDMISVSGHKFHGPKGIGFSYIKDSIKLTNLLFGGEQERNKRAGTLNTDSILGMAAALKITKENNHATQVKDVKDYFEAQIKNNFPFAQINCEKANRSVGISNVYFDGYSGPSIVMFLDMNKICVSSGSACTSGSEQPS